MCHGILFQSCYIYALVKTVKSGQLVLVRECDHLPARQAGQSEEPACAGLQAQPSDRHPRRGLQPHLPDHTLPELQQNPGAGGRAGQPH